MPNWFYIVYLFAIGACVGSFLNVVIYRIPRSLSLISPPSQCPNCHAKLAWYDNVPVLGWIYLRGKCRYCRAPISPRYPIVEAITGLLFVFYYLMFFSEGLKPPGEMTWPIYGLYMALISGLFASSVIDAELYIIPAGIPWFLAAAGVIVHAAADTHTSAGSLLDPPFALALAAGAALGLAISVVLLQIRVLPLSFPDGNLLESDRADLADAAQRGQPPADEAQMPPEHSPAEIRREIRKEMLFLMPPLVLGGLSLFLFLHVPPVRDLWQSAAQIDWLNAALGAVMGALVGGFIIWFTRIAGSYIMGKEAMGLGDVHLMAGIGAVLGAGMAAVTFFLAPFAGIVAGGYLWLTRSRRQLPYGPYLSLAAAVVMLFYAPIADYLRPGLAGLVVLLRQLWP
jgi:leader peptidase (prepilin peptidase)/N-methyltransferase